MAALSTTPPSVEMQERKSLPLLPQAGTTWKGLHTTEAHFLCCNSITFYLFPLLNYASFTPQRSCFWKPSPTNVLHSNIRISEHVSWRTWTRVVFCRKILEFWGINLIRNIIVWIYGMSSDIYLEISKMMSYFRFSHSCLPHRILQSYLEDRDVIY